ncbi:formin-like protein 14 [Cervus elaphus]|uniref:formin-like protein 14 n=1 Tax=Cervus elaphus TaxID=9860 RepID=UPI001CC2D273|nr:formin-like protein 14 [Cervus elaphus]
MTPETARSTVRGRGTTRGAPGVRTAPGMKHWARISPPPPETLPYEPHLLSADPCAPHFRTSGDTESGQVPEAHRLTPFIPRPPPPPTPLIKLWHQPRPLNPDLPLPRRISPRLSTPCGNLSPHRARGWQSGPPHPLSSAPRPGGVQRSPPPPRRSQVPTRASSLPPETRQPPSGPVGNSDCLPHSSSSLQGAAILDVQHLPPVVKCPRPLQPPPRKRVPSRASPRPRTRRPLTVVACPFGKKGPFCSLLVVLTGRERAKKSCKANQLSCDVKTPQNLIHWSSSRMLPIPIERVVAARGWEG